MTDITFDTEWHDGDGIEGAELAATFASLRISVGGHRITRVLDKRAQTVRDSVFVPLYPLAEWLVSNWWFLAYEFNNPTKTEDRAFHGRHTLGTHTEGYALPNLTMVSSGTRTDLCWGGSESDWSTVDFLARGRMSIGRERFRQTCADFVDKVIRRLTELDIEGTFLQEEWQSIQSADNDEAVFCETAAGLGWDPYDLDESRQDQIISLAKELGPLCSEAVSVLDASRPLEDSTAIVAALKMSRSNRLHLQSLGEPNQTKRLKGHYSWEAGWDMARQARHRLGLDGQPVRTMESLAQALGVSGLELEKATQPLATLDGLRLVDGVVVVGADTTLSLGLGNRSAHSRRFAFCRALAEAMTSSGNALLTRGHTDRQRSNRAFAAEFLAPASGLRQRVAHSVLESEEVDELAEEFGVSTLVIVHQLENHGIARLAEADLTPDIRTTF